MRYLHLRAHLQRVRAAYPDLAAVFYEQAHHRGGAATEYAVGCVATVQAWCAEHGIEHAAVHSATIKKHATGKGNAGKQEMVAAMQALGFRPEDDNEADALALLDWAIVQGGESCERAHRQSPAPSERSPLNLRPVQRSSQRCVPLPGTNRALS